MKIHSTIDNLEVIYEDNHLIVINKKAGDLVQGDKTQDIPLSEIVKAYLKKKYNKPGNVYLGVVHRLDRPTSGVVLFAKTSKALPRLNKQFAEKENKKTYWAIVKPGELNTAGKLVHYMLRNPKQNKSYTHKNEVPNSKKAILRYRLLQKLDHYNLLEIDLETGRHHQIRSQLSAMGCPIKGDLKYGFNRSNKDASIHLHAKTLSIMHPVKKEKISFDAPLPQDPLWNAVRHLS
ncbi:RluA family pseudouridine synthase [Mesonia sp. HuA40]|uniref:RluA family pseudouridine synthase n=1 Tax=Mesonia sp. HuA40 TaxID=2602761 RepID=UPI0011CB547D|nr:RluA family pseudouridine synthase [Mesonia sp. HuA40]TXK71020.1 RluA family pseudouridine synthase [Mesonia sp. HuA40]